MSPHQSGGTPGRHNFNLYSAAVTDLHVLTETLSNRYIKEDVISNAFLLLLRLHILNKYFIIMYLMLF
jgi:hypothetical protein